MAAVGPNFVDSTIAGLPCQMRIVRMSRSANYVRIDIQPEAPGFVFRDVIDPLWHFHTAPILAFLLIQARIFLTDGQHRRWRVLLTGRIANPNNAPFQQAPGGIAGGMWRTLLPTYRLPLPDVPPPTQLGFGIIPPGVILPNLRANYSLQLLETVLLHNASNRNNNGANSDGVAAPFQNGYDVYSFFIFPENRANPLFALGTQFFHNTGAYPQLPVPPAAVPIFRIGISPLSWWQMLGAAQLDNVAINTQNLLTPAEAAWYQANNVYEAMVI
jgi:hypothetical protein